MCKARLSSVAIECLSSIQYEHLVERAVIILYIYIAFSAPPRSRPLAGGRDSRGAEGRCAIQSAESLLRYLRLRKRPYHRNCALTKGHP